MGNELSAADKAAVVAQTKQILAASTYGFQNTMGFNANIPTYLDTSVFTNGTYNANNNGTLGIFNRTNYTQNVSSSPFTNPANCVSADSAIINTIGMQIGNDIAYWNQAIKASIQNQQAQADAAAAEQNRINLSNDADVFKKLSKEQVETMKEKEAKIKAAETKFEAAKKAEKEAKNDDDKTKAKADAKTAAQELNKLKEEYDKLDKEYGNGRSLSDKYGKQYSFYSNLSEDELSQISDVNSKIDSMKKELKAKEEEMAKAKQGQQEAYKELMKDKEKAQKYQALAIKGDVQGCRDMLVSKAKQKDYDKLEKDIAERKATITKEIDNLDTYIKKAGENTDIVDYDVHVAEETKKAEEEEKSSDSKDVAKGIADSLYDDKGKLKSESAIIKELTEKFNDNKAYDETTIKNVAKFIHTQMDSADKDKKDGKLDSEDLFKAIKSSTDPQFVDNSEQGKKNLQLLQATYDALKNKSGAFEKKAGSLTDKLTKQALTSALEGLKKTDKPEGDKKAGENPNASGDAVKTDADGNPLNGYDPNTKMFYKNGIASAGTCVTTIDDKTVTLHFGADGMKLNGTVAGKTYNNGVEVNDDSAARNEQKTITQITTAITSGNIDDLTDNQLLMPNQNYCSLINKMISTNKYDAVRKLMCRLNKIAETNGITERLCTSGSYWCNTIEFQKPSKDAKAVTDEDITNKYIGGFHTPSAVYDMVHKLVNK